MRVRVLGQLDTGSSMQILRNGAPSDEAYGSELGASLNIDPRFGEHRIQLEIRRRRRRRRVAHSFIGLVLLVVIGVGVLELPVFAVEHVRITGAYHTSRAQILDAAGVAGHPAMAFLSTSRIERSIGSLPWVASALVVRRWPSTLDIRIVERAAVGRVRLPNGSWVEVDEHGRVLGASPINSSIIPIVASGEIGRPGSVASGMILAGARLAGEVPQALESIASEISVAADGAASLVLADHIEVVFGSVTQLSAKFAAAISVLDALRHGPAGASPVVIDVTAPSAPTVAVS